MFLVITVGGILSWTVTVADAVAELPFKSVTVRITVFGPILVQLNADGFTDIVAALLEPLSTSLAVIDTVPLLSSWTVISFVLATGPDVDKSTFTVKLQVARFPPTSVALQSTTVDPRLKFTPLRVEPAPGVDPESEYRTDAGLQLSVTVGSQPVPVFVYTIPELMVTLTGVE
jgi:hypothetical protein